MTKKKRVLIVGSAPESGGGVAAVIRLMSGTSLWQEYRCFWLGTQIQRNYAWKFWYALRSAFMALFLLWRYDIVHFHTVHDTLGLLIQLPVLLLALLGRKQIILHIHEGNQLEEARNKKFFLWWLRRADVIVLLARRWEERFHEWYPSIQVRTEVLYNACAPVPDVSESERTKSVLFAGFMDENKAPGLLLQAWQRVQERSAEARSWHLSLLGHGNLARYRQQAEQLGLASSVTFPGYVRGEEKERYFRQASIYCLCSYNEGFPMAVLEAWSYGIPVISTPAGGLPEVADEGHNCLTFPFGDAEALADQLLHLMEDEGLRRTLSTEGLALARQRFTPESVAADWGRLYDSL